LAGGDLRGSLIVGALLSTFLIAALPRAIADSIPRLIAAISRRHESDQAASSRLFGAERTAAVDAIREALRPGEPYILLDDDCGYERFWLRNALAPHPALLLSHETKRATRLKVVLRESLRVVVCNGDGSPPDLYGRREFLTEQGVPDGH
jgi:hypothetical protein